MKIIPLAIPGVLRIEERVFHDERGSFAETYRQSVFDAAVGRPVVFVQDNYSRSTRNVLRGLHYQVEQPQGKLLRVTEGSVFDVVVDLRRSSPTFGHWIAETLSADNRRQLWIPEGLAHGFLCAFRACECGIQGQRVLRSGASALLGMERSHAFD